MKRLTTLAAILLYAGAAHAQIFAQQQKRLQLFAKQILLLKTMYSDLKKGYKIVQNGLDLAHQFKNGEFSLHEEHILSLSKINPVIAKSGYVEAILAYDKAMEQVIADQRSEQDKAGDYPADLKKDLGKAADGLTAAKDADAVTLEKLLTPGELQMSDEERMEQIGQLYLRASQRYTDCRWLVNATRKIYAGRRQQQQDDQILRDLYGIKEP